MRTESNQVERWQRNPWVWLIIAIPSLTVIGCMLTIYLALTNPHILVSDGATSSPMAEKVQDGSR